MATTILSIIQKRDEIAPEATLYSAEYDVFSKWVGGFLQHWDTSRSQWVETGLTKQDLNSMSQWINLGLVRIKGNKA